MQLTLYIARVREMSLIGWLKGNRLVDVTAQDPLPVQQQGAITTRTADTLLTITTNLFPTGERDLLGFTGAPEQPTLDACGQYRKLIWFYFRERSGTTSYTIQARATDHNGAPLATGWLTIASGTLPGASDPNASYWGRLEIPATGDAYYDQYRILVNRTGDPGYNLINKIVGVR
jgi:hypothetical protein